MLSDLEMRERMINGWHMGRPETICGNGSLRKYSEKSRVWLPKVCAEYGIGKVCDAGAGDLWYVRGIEWDVEYRPFDLIARDPSVIERDVTRKALPKCDAILCRMVLNHLDEERILMALALFRRSARYLIATQFNGENLPKRSPQFTRLDLCHAPYDLGAPLASVQDGTELVCSLALWKL
jgi:hypothetical protein